MVSDDVKKEDFFDRVQRITEAYLSHRAKNNRIKKEKQQKKSQLADWVEAFIWAACVVLLINQYLFQAYQIPSGSMIDTLLIGDRIFVNKVIYGPELLPGMAKLPSPVKPTRNNIIIFENPDYNSRGAAFDIAQRIIFMLTFSFVDIDRDEAGNPKAHFLIKRAVGAGGDRIINRRGDMYIQFAGEDRIIAETDYNAARGWNHHITRLMKPEGYPALEAAGKTAAFSDIGIKAPNEIMLHAEEAYSLQYPDGIAYETARLEVLRAALPHENRFAREYSRRLLGRYVPAGRILPLGDNRDNSHDGRYFGPVRLSKVLGEGSFKFWPPWRIGAIK